MDEFTKEELNMIYHSVCDRQINLSQGLMKSNLPYERLIHKIKSVIDNYCEHEKTEVIGGFVSKCIGCGMRFGDETQ